MSCNLSDEEARVATGQFVTSKVAELQGVKGVGAVPVIVDVATVGFIVA